MGIGAGGNFAVIFECAQIAELFSGKDRAEHGLDFLHNLRQQRGRQIRPPGPHPDNLRDKFSATLLSPRNSREACSSAAVVRKSSITTIWGRLSRHASSNWGVSIFGIDGWARKPASVRQLKHVCYLGRVGWRVAAPKIIALRRVVLDLVRRIAALHVGACSLP